MGFRIACERRAQGVNRNRGQRHPGQVLAAGDEGGDRVEVLAVGLQRVRRGLPGAAIGQERGEPLRTRRFDTVGLLGAAGHTGQYFMDNGNYPSNLDCNRERGGVVE